MPKLPNLCRNRLGTYRLRIKINGREVKRSLGTKEPALAKESAPHRRVLCVREKNA